MILDKRVLTAFVILVLFNGIDVITTMIGLQLGAVEGDKETIILMQHLGVIEALLLKFYVILLLGLMAVFAHARSSLNAWIFVIGFVIPITYYIYVVFTNLQVIWELLF